MSYVKKRTDNFWKSNLIWLYQTIQPQIITKEFFEHNGLFKNTVLF